MQAARSIVRVFVVLLFVAGCSAGEEKPELIANVYYSKADPHWKDAEKLIDAAAREYAPVKVNKIDIDDDIGYWQLAAAEQELNIVPPGDMTVVIGTLVLTSKDSRRDVEHCFAGVAKRLRNPNDGKGRLTPDVAKFAAEAFGEGASRDALPRPPRPKWTPSRAPPKRPSFTAAP
ncbi:MAG: hypothetical protein NTW87_11470 [Planctomycetota bacterium]|nr:hypothetical protein [Planctomycetota bacterium]